MAHSRWDALHNDSPFGPGTIDIMLAQHRGYILALEDVLEDLDVHGPDQSAYPHHVIRMLLGKQLDEAQRSLQALLLLAEEQEKG